MTTHPEGCHVLMVMKWTAAIAAMLALTVLAAGCGGSNGSGSAGSGSPKIAAEVRWAVCMRSHGVPRFPDPNNQGAFDSANFNDKAPAFHTASNACTSLQPTGAVAAVPGQP